MATTVASVAAIPAAVTTPAVDLSSEENNYNASVLLAGAFHAAAAVLMPGSTTTHTKVNVAVTLGQKMPPVCAYFPKFSWEVPSGSKQERQMLVASLRRQGVLCIPTMAPRL